MSGGAMSGHGMRRLLRSVRKALKNRGQAMHTTHHHLADIPQVGPRGATTNRIPVTAVVPQRPICQNGSRPAVRIDLLGAEVAEDFKKAIREEEEAAAAATDSRALAAGLLRPPNSAPPFLSTCQENRPASPDFSTSTPEILTRQQSERPVRRQSRHAYGR